LELQASTLETARVGHSDPAVDARELTAKLEDLALSREARAPRPDGRRNSP